MRGEDRTRTKERDSQPSFAVKRESKQRASVAKDTARITPLAGITVVSGVCAVVAFSGPGQCGGREIGQRLLDMVEKGL